MRVRRALLIAALLASAVGAAAAQAVTVRAAIEPAAGITEGQTINLVIEMTGNGNGALSRPKLDGLKNLRVVAGPSTSMNSVWTNGRFSMSSKLIYTLVPERIGPASIPALDVEFGGQRFTTEPIEFDVGPAPSGPPRATSVPGSPRGGATRTPAERADLFVVAELGDDDVWVGETVALTLLLYAAERVVGTDLVSEPTLSSFWIEEVDVDPNAEAFERQVDGRRYTVFPLKRQLIVPQAPGSFELEPSVVRLDVRSRRRGDPFDLFGVGRPTSVVRKTEPLTLRVRALPTAGRPESFSGAVGEFEMTAELDRDRAQVNDAVALRVRVEGQGSLRAVASPRLDAPPDVKLFDPESKSDYRVTRNGMRSSKRWEWIMVPLGAGELPLPPVSFSWFDPKTGAYRTSTHAPGPLVVERGEGTARTRPDSRAGLELQRRDLAYLKARRGALRFDDPRIHRREGFALFAIAPLVWVPLLIVLGRRRRRLAADRVRQRARGSGKRARVALQAAARGEASGRPSAVARALSRFVADRFDRSASGLTHRDVDDLLAARGVDAALRGELRTLLERCDFANYVPASTDADAASLVDQAVALIDRLEREL